MATFRKGVKGRAEGEREIREERSLMVERERERAFYWYGAD